MDEIRLAIEFLRSRNVIFDDGLSVAEIIAIETRYGFHFPSDLRAFLQAALPVSIAKYDVSSGFPNWRSDPEEQLRWRLGFPLEGIEFDVEHNQFWLSSWGPRPADLREAIEIARQCVSSAPKLIPVYSHRYIADEPRSAGNPVMSVHQTDIIYYGQNLQDYFEQEFGDHSEDWYGGQRYANWTPEQYHAAHRSIRFWSDLVS